MYIYIYMYVSDGIFINVNNFRNIMNYAVERPRILKGITLALCEPLNLVFIRSTMCVIFPFVHYILQDSVCLSVGWCACSVSLLSPGQHCFLHSAAL